MSEFTITKNERLKKSTAVIEGEMRPETINKYRAKAINSFQDKVKLDGFRKGHIPENVLVGKLGELAIYEEAASLALEGFYGNIIKEAKIHPIGNPRVAITKIALNDLVSFKIETAVMPEVKLPDYKKIASEKMKMEGEIKLDEEEVNSALNEMRRSLAHYEKHHQPNEVESNESNHEDHTGKDIPEVELPELNDQFAKKIGNFDSLEKLKEKMRESILNEKKLKDKEKNRLIVIEEIIKGSEFEVPEVLVESELNKLSMEFKTNIERMGLSYDQYLKHLNKSEEELRKEWKNEAEKRSGIQLILKEIAAKEKLSANEEIVKKEVEAILGQYKDANRENVKVYVNTILQNEEVWKFLESQAVPKAK